MHRSASAGPARARGHTGQQTCEASTCKIEDAVELYHRRAGASRTGRQPGRRRPEGAGKTTLALSVIAQAQQAAGTACYIDAEHALDLRWATTAGVNLSRLVLCRPESGEQALQVASVLVGCGAVEVLVIDSIAALVPQAELAADIGERIPGVQANLLSQALRQLCGPIGRANSEVLVTNQLRQRTAPLAPRPTPPGGGRLGTTPRCVWTCAASKPSTRTGGWSAVACGCWWPRTSSPRLGRPPSWRCGTPAVSVSWVVGSSDRARPPADAHGNHCGLARQREGKGTNHREGSGPLGPCRIYE